MSILGAVQAGNVILLHDDFPGSSEAFYSSLKQVISDSGFVAEETDGSHLVERLNASTGHGSILVLPNSVYFPSTAKTPLLEFLKRGNHLVAVSGPAFSNLLVNVNGRWVNRDEARQELANSQGQPILNFASQDLSLWVRSTSSPQNKTDYEVLPSGRSDISDALHVKISKLDNWDTFGSPTIADPFPGGNTVTTFWAKGGPHTPELILEWREKDGTRWMGVVKLTTEWKRYALTPDDFSFWADGSAPGRGKSGDKFIPANASILTVGLSNGISTQDTGISHEYWIAGIQSVKDTLGSMDLTQPTLESLSPVYKTYPTTAAYVKIPGNTNAVYTNVPVITSLQRSFGLGSDAVRKTRQIPLLYAYDKNGSRLGIASHLFLNTEGTYAGSVWGYLGINQDDLGKNADHSARLIASMLKQIYTGSFFTNAGSEYFAYTGKENIKYGAFISNLTDAPINAMIQLNIISKGKSIHMSKAEVSIPARTINKPQSIQFNAGNLPAGTYTIQAVLSRDNRKIDNITHEFQVINYSKLTKQNTVLVDGNDFVLNGKKWYPLGMNYWPRYSVGQEPSDYWLHWLAPEQYDPVMIEEDLTLARKLKMNLFSIQYGNINQARPLMDFLSRAERHGIKVHVFMPGLHPASQDFNTANPMIKAAHIAESPAFFAYDLGWEVNIGPYTARKQFDRFWQDWVIDRYGSIESAEKDWNYKPDTVDGFLTGPADQQLIKDGDWRIFVAAYRRFWDDEISRRYKQVRDNIRTIDKYHLMGARSGYGGTGAIWIADRFPFDLRSGAKHLDFISPEAYNIGGDRRGFLAGGFHAIYGRYYGGKKPIYWAEYGSPLFFNLEPSNFRNEYTEEQYERERAYYEGIVRMTIDTYANGSAGWWWPGGLRVDEKSDFGVINPDGTPRPAAVVMSQLADDFYKPRTVPEPNAFITIDRDKYTSGYAGVFTEFSGKYVDLLLSGKNPGIKTEGTGTTSADTPLVAVGNTPYNGKNPPKYLNAEFNWIKVNGKPVSDDSVIQVERGKPVYIETSVGNIADAKWLAPKKGSTGGVYLIAKVNGKILKSGITADTPFTRDASIKKFILSNGLKTRTSYELKMMAKGRAEFGEVIRITLDPK